MFSILLIVYLNRCSIFHEFVFVGEAFLLLLTRFLNIISVEYSSYSMKPTFVHDCVFGVRAVYQIAKRQQYEIEQMGKYLQSCMCNLSMAKNCWNTSSHKQGKKLHKPCDECHLNVNIAEFAPTSFRVLSQQRVKVSFGNTLPKMLYAV